MELSKYMLNTIINFIRLEKHRKHISVHECEAVSWLGWNRKQSNCGWHQCTCSVPRLNKKKTAQHHRYLPQSLLPALVIWSACSNSTTLTLPAKMNNSPQLWIKTNHSLLVHLSILSQQRFYKIDSVWTLMWKSWLCRA